jgi:hypothetical protein
MIGERTGGAKILIVEARNHVTIMFKSPSF